MEIEQIAFEVSPGPPSREVRVNFGILSGREASTAEIDELGRLLRPDLTDVTIVAETRYEIGPVSEASVYLVRIELPNGTAEMADLVVKTATFWARMCVAERPAPV